jgi:hypothetical protein
VDLNAIAADRYDALGQQTSVEMFNDVQHTKKAGAKINAESVVAGLKRLKNCPLAAYLATPSSEKRVISQAPTIIQPPSGLSSL